MQNIQDGSGAVFVLNFRDSQKDEVFSTMSGLDRINQSSALTNLLSKKFQHREYKFPECSEFLRNLGDCILRRPSSMKLCLKIGHSFREALFQVSLSNLNRR
ncbi:hypothetical protein F3G14_19275 [Acinetobacter baumannii]|nr:hypothetical protein F3G14_19275 [Acinetobacter baumannii]